MKMGLDFGLSLGKKVNHAASVDSESTKKAGEGEEKTRAFTISKCATSRALALPPLGSPCRCWSRSLRV